MTKRLHIAAAFVLLACSSGTTEDDAGSGGTRADTGVFPARDTGVDDLGADRAAQGDAGDDALIVPEALSVMALPGGNGVLDVIALTVRRGLQNTEVYAALMNTGDVPACSAGFSVELFDENEQSLAAGIGGLLTPHFYRRTDGSDAIAACVSPGDITMAALTDFPSDIAIEDVRYAVYRCPYFALDVVPIDGLSIREVMRVPRDDGTAYAGTLVNGLDVAVSNPSVTVFPVNGVGRPLGSAIGSGEVEILPGGSWAFETSAVDEPGVDQLAYPAAALEN